MEDLYWEVEMTDADVEFMKNGKIKTYNKNKAEEEIKWMEEVLRKKGGTMSEEWKQKIRDSYEYVGEDK